MAVLVLTPDAQLRIGPDGAWLEAGSAVVELLGYTPAELIGRDAAELVHPDDREQVIAAMRAGIEVSSRVVLEVRYLRRDGSVLYADARLDVERDGGARPVGYTVTIRDAAHRRRSEELEQRWEILFRGTSRGIAVTDPATGRLEAVNPAWASMHGGAESDFRGRRVAESLTPAAAARLPGLTEGLQPGEMIAYESEHVRRDGSTFPVAVELLATRYGGPREPRWLTWIDDLTERRRAEEEAARHAAGLARSNADLDRFAAVMAHDLQSPLRVIVGSARVLERRAAGHLTGEELELVQLIANGARRMAALVDGIRVYSSVRGDEQTEDALPFGEVVDEVVAGMAAELEAAGAAVAVGDLPTVCGDRVGLVQLVQNLLGNALKFRGAALPAISVEAEPVSEPEPELGGGAWRITVADNGIGIEPAYAERVFGFGERLHTQDAIPGTGIGLAVCKTVVERHGGRLWVEPAAGGGSAFHFTLPAGRR
ncbi:MAG TPA: PAS domain S-box protein [Solirubrobacteraceae bacterium]|nr:PAS domain S-box protein [Solirubrobacteraceae bacterium]